MRIKNTSSEWFNRGITEKFSLRDKLVKKFKSSHLKIDWEIYKEARTDIQRMMKQKKYFENKTGKKYSKTKRTLTNGKVAIITKQKSSTTYLFIVHSMQLFEWISYQSFACNTVFLIHTDKTAFIFHIIKAIPIVLALLPGYCPLKYN